MHGQAASLLTRFRSQKDSSSTLASRLLLKIKAAPYMTVPVLKWLKYLKWIWQAGNRQKRTKEKAIYDSWMFLFAMHPLDFLFPNLELQRKTSNQKIVFPTVARRENVKTCNSWQAEFELVESREMFQMRCLRCYCQKRNALKRWWFQAAARGCVWFNWWLCMM